MVTEKMVEKAAEAYWMQVYGRHRKANKWPDDVYGSSQELFRDGCRAALEAALSTEAEPDGWICENDFTLDPDLAWKWEDRGLSPKPFYFCLPQHNAEPVDVEQIERIRSHVKAHQEKERATFSIAGVKALLDRIDAAPPPPTVAVKATPDALEKFTAYFVKNYPGPDTIIHDPKWHAPKIFRAAAAALSAQVQDVAGTRTQAIEDVLSALTAHELYQYRPKAFQGFIDYARSELAAAPAAKQEGKP